MIATEQPIWDAYNLLLGGPDTERLHKLLVRYDLFRMTLEVPGDIVECGVFKGTGRWTESQAVARFFADKSVVLKTLPWSRTPTA